MARGSTCARPLNAIALGEAQALLLQDGQVQADVLNAATVSRIWPVAAHTVQGTDGCPQLLMA